VEVVVADASPGTEGICTNKAEPRSEDETGGDASALESLGGWHTGTWWCPADHDRAHDPRYNTSCLTRMPG
jgi:hypothetical protein